MRSPKHTQVALEKEPWKKGQDGNKFLRAEEFKDVRLFGDILDTFKDNRKDGRDLPWQSIFIGEYRYWLDSPLKEAGVVFRSRIETRELQSRDLTRVLKKMIRRLEEMPDNSTFSTSELLDKCVKHFEIHNLGDGPFYEFLDGEYYFPYGLESGITDSIQWEMDKRFHAAAERHGFMIDSADSAFKVLGLPFNIPCTYRRKANLLKKAEKLADSDTVKDESGGLLYYAKTWKPKDGNTLTLLKIPAQADEINMLAGTNCAQIEVLSGQVLLRTHHHMYCTVYGESEPHWVDTGEEARCNGKGRAFCEGDYPGDEPPFKSNFTIRNIGGSPAVVLISKEPPFEEPA